MPLIVNTLFNEFCVVFMRYKGKITDWKNEKCFGFICPDEGGKAVFVHISSFADRQAPPMVNQPVSYELKADEKGRMQAIKVMYSTGHGAPKSSPRRTMFLLMLPAFFVVFLVLMVLMNKLPFLVLAVYLATSLAAFFAYWIDKSAAVKGRWRTRESTLHVFGLMGGWPGALMAQQILRHKSKKQSFQMVFWITVAVNCGFLVWFFSDSGSSVLRSILYVASRGFI